MTLAEGVKKYLELAGDFGKPVALARFGLSKEETEKTISAWDEDYQINRFLLLTVEPAEEPARANQIYLINGFECSHITFQSEINNLL